MGTVDPGQLPVGGDGPSHVGIPRCIGEGRVDAVAGSHQATGPTHPPHLDQGPHRVRHVLEHLMGVDHVEGPVGEGQREQVGHLEGHPLHARRGRHPTSLVDYRRGGIDPDHPTGCDRARQIDGEGPGPAADVQQGLSRGEAGQQIGG